MSHTVLWPGKTFFYPIGNTSPVCFTQDLPVYDPANILLLGCGDPRSILYTVYMNTNGSQLDRTLDLTCVDIEGAILARNAILFTLLGEENDIEKTLPLIWNIFFDIFIDQPSLSLLRIHCTKLIAASASLDDWKTSSYSRYISFCDANTLSVVRKYWQLYLKSTTFTKAKQKQLRASTASKMKAAYQEKGFIAQNFNHSATRSAGPLAPHAMRIVSRGFQRFWETGVTAYDPDTIAKAQLVNPMFLYSVCGDEFNVHYLSYPLTCFHLAELFASVDTHGTSEGTRGWGEEYKDDLLLNVVVPGAKKQFFAWCRSSSAVLRKGGDGASTGTGAPSALPLVVRLLCGDALAVCKALHYYRDTKSPGTPVLTTPWKASCITFDTNPSTTLPALPTSFDVIDTSNLSDHLGLLNILTHAGSLLQRSSSFGVLYTETLLPGGKGTLDGLLERACCDLGTLSLLLGLVPTTLVSGFTAQSNVHEVHMYHVMNMAMDLAAADARGRRGGKGAGFRPVLGQYHERLVWRRPMPGDVKAEVVPGRAVFAHAELAKVLFGVYLKMFKDENISAKFENLFSSDKTSALMSLARSGEIHYVRRSFAEYLAAIRREQMFGVTGENPDAAADARALAEADWNRVMGELFDMIQNDRTLLIGSNFFQDLGGHLHLLGLYTADWIQPSETIHQRQFAMGCDVYYGWNAVPPIVWIVLTVPRSRLRTIQNSLDKLGTPILQCEIFGRTASNNYPSIDVVYGKAVVERRASRGDQGSKKVQIVADERGREGASDLVVAFQAPASALMIEPQMSVALVVRSTPHSSAELMPKLGVMQHIFAGRVDNERHVHIVTSSPFSTSTISDAQVVVNANAEESREGNRQKGRNASVDVSIDRRNETVRSMSVRLCVVGDAAEISLAQGAQATMESASPCGIRVAWKQHAQVHAFPLPVDFDQARFWTSRNASVVEVVAPVSTTVTTRSMTFPVFLTEKGPALWDVHRVVLDKLPSLELSTTSVPHITEWLSPHVGLMLSDAERAVLNGTKQPENEARKASSSLKQSLCSILLSAAGDQGKAAPCVVGLVHPSIGCYTFIFIAGLRLDLASHTVVADSWVLPLNDGLVEKLGSAPRELFPDVTHLMTEQGEMDLWKHLLPAATERCRTWTHKPDCEYQRRAAIPLTLAVNEVPICSCGSGVGAAEVPAFRGPWKAFAPYVTRAALGPLFAVSYLESVGGIGTGAKPSSSSFYVNAGRSFIRRIVTSPRYYVLSLIAYKFTYMRWVTLIVLLFDFRHCLYQ